MRFTIGENLRRERARAGITQEQLAETLGVSPQAVSRWENDSAYPDITLLPGLANYYHTTVDALLGAGDLRREQRISDVYNAARAGDMERAVSMAREGLRVFPGDTGLMMALCETLARQSQDPACRGEAIALAQRVLKKGDASMKAQSTIAVTLIFLYLGSGQTDKAREQIRVLPHIWECRELLAPEAESGEAGRQALRAAVRKALVFLCQKIDALPDRDARAIPDYVQLGVDFSSPESNQALLSRLADFLAQ